MATRRNETVSVKKAAAAEKTKPAKHASAKVLLRAGLKALGNVRDDVIKRQTHVIDSLLGLSNAEQADGKPGALDSFGIRNFEDVFDQRVAGALQRLGMPSTQDIQELREQMRLLLEHLERIESGRRKR